MQRGIALNGPLTRAAVVGDDLLILYMHHALFDFWSSQFIFLDMINILCGKEPIERAPFCAYIAFQQKHHNAEARKSWKEYLQSSAPSVLDFESSTHSSKRQKFTISIKEDLSTFCAANGVTIGTLIYGAWALTLSTHLRIPDVVFMTAFSGRDANVEGILTLDGPTLYTVPMHIKINPAESILYFAKAVQENLWTLSSHAYNGLRNTLTDSRLKANAFNTMVNVLTGRPSFDKDGHLVPIVTYEDNFKQYPTIEVDEMDPSYVKLLFGSPVELEPT